MALKIPVGERHIPACVRSFPERSRVNLMVLKNFGAHMRHVRGAHGGLTGATGGHGFEGQMTEVSGWSK